MYADSKMSVLGLANTYAKYFTEDFTINVLEYLKGSYTVSQDILEKYIKTFVDTKFDTTRPLVITNANAVTRFLFECAEFAISKNYEDPEDRKNWEFISALPSLHHSEIQALIYSSADLYKSTIERTILGVIIRDADMTAKTIMQTVQTRTTLTETGGTLNIFNWGILNDGLWLNSALLRAYELASIFRPGDPVVAYYTQAAFNFAKQYASMKMLSEEDVLAAHGDIDVILSQTDPRESSELLDGFSQSDLNFLLFKVGVLSNYVATWEDCMVYPQALVHCTQQLSFIARLLNLLLDTARLMEDQSLISDTTKDRLSQVYNVVTLVLAGYEALRETKFAESLIISVTAPTSDPIVDVLLNADTLNAYHTAGGDDADLIRFGQYLDPRKGMPTMPNGWSLSYVLARKDEVVPSVMAEDYERLQKLRDNDAAVIQNEAIKILNRVANSYNEACQNTQMRSDITQRIAAFARDLTNPNVDVIPVTEIAKILATIIDDAFVITVLDKLMQHLDSENPNVSKNAVYLTILETAVNDVVSCFTEQEE